MENRYGVSDDFRELFEKHKDRVYSIALRYAREAASAMDIAQDTFLKLMTRMEQYRGEAGFEAWLYRIVVNACLDHRRSGRRLQPLADGFLDLFRSPPDSALDGLLRDEMRELVQQAVSKLPPEQRIVVILRYTEGLAYEEIAEILKISKGTVASRLNRAHASLERRLQGVRGRSYA
jgi:RNA polymerase sigma-70 factor (ECF subfamily)